MKEKIKLDKLFWLTSCCVIRDEELKKFCFKHSARFFFNRNVPVNNSTALSTGSSNCDETDKRQKTLAPKLGALSLDAAAAIHVKNSQNGSCTLPDSVLDRPEFSPASDGNLISSCNPIAAPAGNCIAIIFSIRGFTDFHIFCSEVSGSSGTNRFQGHRNAFHDCIDSQLQIFSLILHHIVVITTRCSVKFATFSSPPTRKWKYSELQIFVICGVKREEKGNFYHPAWSSLRARENTKHYVSNVYVLRYLIYVSLSST